MYMLWTIMYASFGMVEFMIEVLVRTNLGWSIYVYMCMCTCTCTCMCKHSSHCHSSWTITYIQHDYRNKLSGYRNKLSGYRNKLSEYRNKLSEYRNKLWGYRNKLSEYRNKLSECRNKLSGYLSHTHTTYRLWWSKHTYNLSTMMHFYSS